MNKMQLEGQWLKLKGSAQEQWGKLTNDDIERVLGKRDKLVGTVKERYGITRQEAEQQVDEWSAKHMQ